MRKVFSLCDALRCVRHCVSVKRELERGGGKRELESFASVLRIFLINDLIMDW